MTPANSSAFVLHIYYKNTKYPTGITPNMDTSKKSIPLNHLIFLPWNRGITEMQKVNMEAPVIPERYKVINSAYILPGMQKNA